MKQKILDLIIAAKRDDPETGSFAEWLAEYLVANGVTVQEWIPVGERLPERGQQVIAYSGYAWKPKVFSTTFYDKDDYGWLAVSHWMPMPDPPGKDGA